MQTSKNSCNVRTKSRRNRMLAAAAVGAGAQLIVLSATQVRAANVTWANTGTAFSQGANWVGGVAPANGTATDVAVFQGTPTAQPFIDASRSIGAFDFQSGGWNFTGTSRLSMGGQAPAFTGISSSNNASGQITFDNPWNLSNTNILPNNSTLDLRFNALFEMNGTGTTRTLHFTGPGKTTFASTFNIVSGAAPVIRTFTINAGSIAAGTHPRVVEFLGEVTQTTGNTGILRLDGDDATLPLSVSLLASNSYNGGTILNRGTLTINQEGSLGSVPGAFDADNINFTGSGTVALTAGLGTFALNANRGIQITGTTSRTATLDTGPDNTWVVTQSIANSGGGTANLTKAGAGTMILSGNNSGLTGTLNFAAGTLVIDNPQALPGTGPLVNLRWGGGTLVSTAPYTVAIPSQLTNASTIGGSQTITFSGPLQFNGTSDRTERFSQDAGVVTQVNGGLVISTVAPRIFTISGTGEVAFNSVISETTGQAGTLRLTNTGTVTLNVANTYTGGTVIDDVDVDLNIANDNVFGPGAITWNAGSIRSTAAPRTIANAITLGAGDTKLLSGPADWTLTGPMTVTGGGKRTLSIGATNTATITNSIGTSDGTGFAKAGGGTLVLAAPNTYVGGTGVHNGWLKISSDAQLGQLSDAVEFDNGTLTAGGTLLVSASVTSSRELQTGPIAGTVDTDSFAATFGNVTGAGTLIKHGSGTLTVNNVRSAGLTVANGTVAVAPNGTDAGTSNVATLTITGPGSLDLNDNDLIVGAGTTMADVENLVRTARNGGNWNQPGLTSSTARNNPNHTTGLGVISGAEKNSVGGTGTFSGQTYAATDTLVKYTWNGDANLDGRVTFDDYVKIDTGFNTHLTGWLNGDFNYSGAVNFDDYVLIDIAFNQQNGTLGRAIDWISGDDRSVAGLDSAGLGEVLGHLDQFGASYGAAFLAAVPEPGVISTGCLIALATAMRRTRRGPRRSSSTR